MRAPTKAEREHMDAVAALGCIVCRLEFGVFTPACIHHTYYGRAGRRDHMRVISLCPTHHQTGGIGVALHAGKRTWERIHGTEAELLDHVAGILELIR